MFHYLFVGFIGRNKSKNVLFILLVFCLGFSATDGFAKVLTQKTLMRRVDAVFMKGGMVDEATGRPISNLRLYAYHKGVFEPIRYQIDERICDEGDFVYTEGPLNNKEEGNGKLKSWDMILFYASDSGDRVSQNAWTPGYTSGIEIEVIDPLNGQKGWCYLLYFASNPPPRSSKPDWVNFDAETNTWKGQWFENHCIITKDGLHTSYYEHWAMNEKGGGNGKSWADRLKIRTKVKLLFGTTSISFTEELIKADLMAYKNGPIRGITRHEQYGYIAALKKKVFRTPSNTIGYRDHYLVPAAFQLPIKPSLFTTSVVMRFANDFSPNVLGGKTCYASDPTKWYSVNGKMDSNEKEFDPEVFDKWRLTNGDFGTLLFSVVYDTDFMKHIKIKRGIIDDITKEDLPEQFPGCIGMSYQDWHLEDAPRGTYYFYLTWYFPGHLDYEPSDGVTRLFPYEHGDEVQYLNVVDHPLEIRVGEKTWKSNPLEPMRTFAKKYE